MSYEVCIRIEFSSECLGNIRKPDPEPNLMLRDQAGTVIFNQSWWRSATKRAADVFGKHQMKIREVRWTPEVDGTIKLYDRYYFANGERHIKQHEAFLVGDVVGVRALVPDDIPIDDFESIMSVAGRYFGISPFGWRKGKGRFKVLEVERFGNHVKGSRKHVGRIPDDQLHETDPGADSDSSGQDTDTESDERRSEDRARV